MKINSKYSYSCIAEKIIPSFCWPKVQCSFNRKSSAVVSNGEYLNSNNCEIKNATNLENAKKSFGSIQQHIYNSVKIKDSQQLIKQLISSEIYNKEGLIVLNKPFGVRRYSPDENEEHRTKKTLNRPVEFKTSIQRILQSLKENYNEAELEVVVCPERWSSGVLVLSTNPKTSEKLRKSIRITKALKETYLKYLAITQGIPEPPNVKHERIGTYLKHISDVGNVAVITKELSKRAIRNREVYPNYVSHKIICKSEIFDVSLVQVDVLGKTNYFVRVWLSHCLSPVLGDSMFGGRVKTIMGRKVLVSPGNAAFNQGIVPDEILKALKLETNTSELIPIHLHLSSVRLKNFSGKNDLDLSVPIPMSFEWSCDQLGLNFKSQ